MKYTIHFIHKIAPRHDDTVEAELPDNCFSDCKTLAKVLRSAKILQPGQRLKSFRTEGNRTVAFPSSGIWHSIIIKAN